MLARKIFLLKEGVLGHVRKKEDNVVVSRKKISLSFWQERWRLPVVAREKSGKLFLCLICCVSSDRGLSSPKTGSFVSRISWPKSSVLFWTMVRINLGESPDNSHAAVNKWKTQDFRSYAWRRGTAWTVFQSNPLICSSVLRVWLWVLLAICCPNNRSAFSTDPHRCPRRGLLILRALQFNCPQVFWSTQKRYTVITQGNTPLSERFCEVFLVQALYPVRRLMINDLAVDTFDQA